MKTQSPFGQIDDVLMFLRENREGNVLITNVCALAEIMIGAQKSFYSTLDSAIYREFREIAEYIANAKAEINALQANELHKERIPSAGRQLDAIVKATEEATNRIMEQAEAIMAADPSDSEAYQAVVNRAVMEIFEACSFQDITGQRISKVVTTLQHIERRVSHFARAVNAKDVPRELSEEEEAQERRMRELMLHGPPLEGEGVSQSVVDRLIGDDDSSVPAAGTAAGMEEQARSEKAGQRQADTKDVPKRDAAAGSASSADGTMNTSDIDALFS